MPLVCSGVTLCEQILGQVHMWDLAPKLFLPLALVDMLETDQGTLSRSFILSEHKMICCKVI